MNARERPRIGAPRVFYRDGRTGMFRRPPPTVVDVNPREPDRIPARLGEMKRKLKARGLKALDRRSARSAFAFGRALIDDLGGAAHVTAAQRALVDAVVVARVILSHADAFLLARESVLTRKGRFVALVRERMAVADSLTRTLTQLGLERRPRPILTLADYLSAGAGHEEPGEASEEATGGPVGNGAEGGEGAGSGPSRCPPEDRRGVDGSPRETGAGGPVGGGEAGRPGEGMGAQPIPTPEAGLGGEPAKAGTAAGGGAEP